jgi:hypothetical protein
VNLQESLLAELMSYGPTSSVSHESMPAPTRYVGDHLTRPAAERHRLAGQGLAVRGTGAELELDVEDLRMRRRQMEGPSVGYGLLSRRWRLSRRVPKSDTQNKPRNETQTDDPACNPHAISLQGHRPFATPVFKLTHHHRRRRQ